MQDHSEHYKPKANGDSMRPLAIARTEESEVAELRAKLRALEERLAAAQKAEEEQARLRQLVEESQARAQTQTDELKAKVDLILAAVDAAARGDLTRQIAISGDDAVARLAQRLNAFLGTMRRSVGNIADNAT